MEDSDPNPQAFTDSAAKMAGGVIGLLPRAALAVFGTYELPVAMLTRTGKGVRYARLLRLLLGLLIGSLAYSGCELYAFSSGLAPAPETRASGLHTLPPFGALAVLSLGAYAVAVARRWRRERRRDFTHTHFVGFPRLLSPAYRSYLVEPAALAALGAALILTRLSAAFGLYLGSVAGVMALQLGVRMWERRKLVLDLRDAELVQHGLRTVDPVGPEAIRHAAAPASREELMRVFSLA